MTIFYENITKLCQEKGITINGMCNLIGLSNATATQWKHGAKPSPNTLSKIAVFFGIPTDELLNKKDCSTNNIDQCNSEIDKMLYENKRPNKHEYEMNRFKNIIYGNIIALCRKSKITVYHLMNILKIPDERMYLIKENGSILDIDLLAIAMFFNVNANEITNGKLYMELEDIVNYPNQPTEKERIAEAYKNAPTYIQKAIKKLLSIEEIT